MAWDNWLETGFAEERISDGSIRLLSGAAALPSHLAMRTGRTPPWERALPSE